MNFFAPTSGRYYLTVNIGTGRQEGRKAGESCLICSDLFLSCRPTVDTLPIIGGTANNYTCTPFLAIATLYTLQRSSFMMNLFPSLFVPSYRGFPEGGG